MHTPSTPEVKQPASATDPRFSTSGILNAQNKEKNRQGLSSTFGGRTGEAMDINKFTDKKIAMRDPSAMPVLEQVARLYSGAKEESNRANLDVLNKLYASYGANKNTVNNDVNSLSKLGTTGEKFNTLEEAIKRNKPKTQPTKQ